MGELVSNYQDFVAPVPQSLLYEGASSLGSETILAPERQGNAMQYDPGFDQKMARELLGIKRSDPLLYRQKEKEFDSYIGRQIRSMQGERLGLEISDLNYRVIDGKLVGEDLTTPLEDVYMRGLEYLSVHGRPVDRQREAAEVRGFLKIQDIFTNELSQREDLVVWHGSPSGGEGSMYQHKFYDMFKMKRDGTIQAARFNAGHKDVLHALGGLSAIDGDVNLPLERTAESLLANPIILRSELSLDDIHKKLQGNSDLLSREKFDRIMARVKPLVDDYTKSLKDDPGDEESLNLHLDAIMNAVDIEADKDDEEQIYVYTSNDVYRLGIMPVRMVDTGCGPSGGFYVGGYGSPMGVMDMGLMMMGSLSASLGEKTLSCTCPFCFQKVNAVIAGGMITCSNISCKKSAPYSC